MLLDSSNHLPVGVQRFDSESGMSHIMRAFWGNGVSTQRVYEWLHLRLSKSLRDLDARVLAWAVQAPPEWLAERLFLASGLPDDRRLRLGMHHFSPASLLIGKTARVCPCCLAELGFCELSWSFKLAPFCVRHGVPLLAACVHCKRPIVWNRPQIDICTCGRYFKPVPAVGEPPRALVEWSRWVAKRLTAGTASESVTETQCTVPRLLEELSLDGAFRLVEAFGFLQKPDEPPLFAAATARSVAGAVGVVDRGLERLMLIEGDVQRVRDLGPQVHLAALERLRSNATNVADANCAALLLRYLGDRGDRNIDMRGRHARGQMALFS